MPLISPDNRPKYFGAPSAAQSMKKQMGAPGFSGSATGQSITPSSSLASSSQQRQVKPVSRKKNTDETLFKGFTFTEESMLKERYQAEKQMLKDRGQVERQKHHQGSKPTSRGAKTRRPVPGLQ